MRDAVLDYRANPEITGKCPKNLDFCRKETKFDPTIDEDGGKIEGNLYYEWAVLLVVKWSACLASTLTMRVQIPKKSTIFL